MESVLGPREAGKNAIPDFARNLRQAFFVHCRDHKVEPEAAVRMAMEPASGIMDLTANFRKHLHSAPHGEEA